MLRESLPQRKPESYMTRKTDFWGLERGRFQVHDGGWYWNLSCLPIVACLPVLGRKQIVCELRDNPGET